MSAGGIAGIIILIICFLIGCLCYHRKKITYVSNYVMKRNHRKHEREEIGHLFRNVKMSNSHGTFNVEQTPDEYIIRCNREDFQIYMEDYIAKHVRQNGAAEDRGLINNH